MPCFLVSISDASATKSSEWISTGKSTPSSTPTPSHKPGSPSKGEVAFDEMAEVGVSGKLDLEEDNKASSEMGATGVSRETYIQVVEFNWVCNNQTMYWPCNLTLLILYS